MTKSFHQTLLANFMQQASAVILLLFLPNLLDKHAFAQIVFISVLLSFMVTADLGLSLVYGRLAPALNAAGDIVAIRTWNSSVLAFGLIASCFFSIFTAFIYWLKYGHLEYVALLLFLPVGLYWISFHVSQISVKGDFTEYRRVIGMRSLAALLALPLVLALGLIGWFVSQIASVLLVLAYIGRGLPWPLGKASWSLVCRHVPEGLLLCAITAAWMQLLNFGKLYSSVNYSTELIAHYGVAGAAYQSLSTLLISAFLPVTVAMLGHFGLSNKDAFTFMGKVLRRSIWWVLIGTLIVIEVAPHLFRIFFPSYQFDVWMLMALLLGVAFYPFLILFGTCMVGKRRGAIYLLLILVSLLASVAAALLIDWFAHGLGAAWGQFLGVMIFTWCLYWVVYSLFAEEAMAIWVYVGRSLAVITVLALIYMAARWIWS